MKQHWLDKRIRITLRAWGGTVLVLAWLPLMLFFLTWQRLPVAVAATVASLAVLGLGLRDLSRRPRSMSYGGSAVPSVKQGTPGERGTPGDQEEKEKPEVSGAWTGIGGETLPEYIDISIGTLLLLLLLTAIIGYLCGWTRWAPQVSTDWYKHNALLHDLTDYEWPVVYTSGRRALLTYYIGSYLFPAAVGKAFAALLPSVNGTILSPFGAAYAAMFIQNCLWLLLMELGLIACCRVRRGRRQVLVAVLFFLFGDLLQLLKLALQLIPGHSIYDFFLVGEVRVLFRSVLVTLGTVFSQCTVPWALTLLLLMRRRDFRNYLAILCPALLCGTFSFAGMVLLSGIYVLLTAWERRPGRKQMTQEHRLGRGLAAYSSDGSRSEHKLTSYSPDGSLSGLFKELFSVQNVLTALVPMGVVILYYLGNILGKKSYQTGTHLLLAEGGWKALSIYVALCLLTFVPYALLVRRFYAHSKLYVAVVTAYALVPMIRMGKYNDFCMNVPIPLQLTLFVMLILYLQHDFGEGAQGCRERVKKRLVMLIMALGMLHPLCEQVYKVIRDDVPGKMQYVDEYGSLSIFTVEDFAYPEDLDDMMYNYFTYEPEDTLFWRYLAKHPQET